MPSNSILVIVLTIIKRKGNETQLKKKNEENEPKLIFDKNKYIYIYKSSDDSYICIYIIYIYIKNTLLSTNYVCFNLYF